MAEMAKTGVGAANEAGTAQKVVGVGRFATASVKKEVEDSQTADAPAHFPPTSTELRGYLFI